MDRVGLVDRLSLGVDVDGDALVVFVAIGVVEIVGTAAGFCGKRTIEKAAAGVAGVIAATVTFPPTATATAAAATGWRRGRGRGRRGSGLLCGADVARFVDLGLVLATAVTVAAVAIPIRLVLVVSLSPAVLLGIVGLSVFSISIVTAAVPIPIALIPGTTIVMTIPGFARGKAARHARG